jgi:hypothetical protein
MNKFKKNKTESSTLYSVINPHTVEQSEVEDNFLIAVFIDPGIKNCAIRCVKYNFKERKIETLLQVKYDFTQGDSDNYYVNSVTYLDSIYKYLKNSHWIVIECQMSFAYDNIRISQHIISYMIIKLKNKGFYPYIIEINSKVKSKFDDAPKKMKKKELKIYCRDKAIQILEDRGDFETANLIRNAKKADDHGDTVCYDEWWRLHLNIMI